MVGATGFEPATFWSQTRRSTRLSYAPRIESLPQIRPIRRIRPIRGRSSGFGTQPFGGAVV